MRPDEHKKKKNAVYKKKHGIETKGTEKGKDKKEKHKDEKKTPGDPGTASTTSSSKSKSATPQVLSDSSSESDIEVVHRKSYKRREIVSNWKKYELDPADVERSVQARGEDFNKLLSMAGEAMSHFRFQDELEWEEEATSGKGDNPSKDFLALDLSDITASMSCVPIHRVLGIDENLFPKDILESHMKSVSEKRSMYSQSWPDTFPDGHKGGQSKSLETEKCPHQDKERQRRQAKTRTSSQGATSTNDTLSSSTGKTPSQTREANPARVTDNTALDTSDKPLHIKDTNKGNSPPHHLAHHDSGTGSCAVGNRTSPGIVPVPPQATAVPPSIDDAELDQLLDMDVTHRADAKILADKKPPPVSMGTVKDDQKEAEELEDWLDSILD